MSDPAVKWNFDADFLQACNCDYGCPCEFSAPPTMGYCEGMVAWRISRGSYGRVPLTGLGLAMAVHWPKAIHQGNGIARPFVDERATPEQRDALLQIASGKAGGMPFAIIATTFAKVLEPRFVPFRFKFDGRNTSVAVGDAIAVRMAPIKNPVTGDPESVRIEHSTGFIFKHAECTSAAENWSKADGVDYSWPNKAGFVTQTSYAN